MKPCPRCQTVNRSEAAFCRECSQFLGTTCPNCLSALPTASRFCDACGIQLASLASLTGWVAGSLTGNAEHASANWLARIAPDQPAAIRPAADRPASRTATDDHDVFAEKPAGLAASDLAGAAKPVNGALTVGAARGADVESERRVVTMLFCDVHNSTATAEKLDPEEWTEIINGAFEYMIRPIYKFEGTVARLMGDAILAFFGAPMSHEDDPQRAVLAGLDIVNGIATYRKEVERRWGIDFNVRVGINTGLVVVGNVGSDLRTEYTAMGDAINVAARMEQTAQPGTVQIAEGTYRIIASEFEVEKIGGIDVKGKSEPVTAWRVLKYVATARRLRGLTDTSVPLIGRVEARRSLSAAIDRTLRGNGQIVTIIGEVGMGKSRLIAEMRAEWDEKAHKSDAESTAYSLDRWYETFSLSYESTRPYGLFQNFLRQVLGATHGESPAALQASIAEFVAAMLPREHHEYVQNALAALFGLSQTAGTTLEGEAFRKQFFQIIASLLEVWAKDNPGVIVCDDLHWSDQASIDLLVHLFPLTDRLPILFVCALRPDRDAPGWQVKIKADADFPHHYSEIQLAPLTPQQSIAMVNQLLPQVDLPETLLETILARAAGNPFFLEEVVRALRDEGTIVPGGNGTGWKVAPNHNERAVNIPDSLQSLLMARIDRLDEPQRHTLQMAALIGRSFYYRVLEAIALDTGTGLAVGGHLDQQLGDLQRMNLITLAARLPEIEFIFRQALVQELAYSSILRKNRREYHERVGEAIEALFPDQLEEQAIVLARHFSAAGDQPRAVKYHTMAGDAAFRLYANKEAAQHYAEALEAAPGASLPPEQLIHLYTRRGRALELSSRLDDAVTVYEMMRQQAAATDDQKMELAALIPLATLFSTPTSLYDPQQGDALSRQAIQLAQALGDRAAEARILWNLLNLNRFSGQTEEALEAGEQSLSIARELDLREQMAYTASDLCHLYNRTGQYGKTIETLQETRTLWRELGNTPMLADNLATSSYVHAFTGDYDGAAEYSREAFRISESIQNAWGCSYSQAMIGPVYWEQGNPDLAMETMRSSLHYAEKAGFVVALVYTRSEFGVVLGELGEIGQGYAAVREAIRIAENGRPQLLRYPLSQLARLHLLAGDIEAAATAVAELRERTGPFHMVQPYVIAVAECQLALQQGDVVEASRLLEQRLADLRRYGMKAYIPQALYLLAQARQQAGLESDALANLHEARDLAAAIGSRWMEWRILATMASLSSQADAKNLCDRAKAIIDGIEQNISDPALRASFHNRPDVHSLAHV